MHSFRYPRPALTIALLAAISAQASAADFYKSNNEANLDLIAAWENLDGTPVVTAPVNATNSIDTWIWDNRVTSAADVNLDGIHNVTVSTSKDLGVRTIRILNPALPILFNGNGRTFTPTTTGGIDMAAATQDFTLTNLAAYRVASSSAQIAMNVAAGRTLTFGAAAPVTVRNNSSNVTVSINTDGISSGTVRFTSSFAPSHVIIGAGLVEFSNPSGNARLSTHTTIVNGGTLVLNNTSGSATGSGTSTTSGFVTLNNTSTLTGSGIVAGIVTANAGTTLAPGNEGLGTLTVGSLVLETGSTLLWEGINPTEADTINVTMTDGLVINGGTLKLYNPGTTEPFSGLGVFTLFSQTGAIGGAGLSALTIDETTRIEGRNYTISLGAGGVTLSITDGAVTTTDWATGTSGTWSTTSNWAGTSVPGGDQSIARLPGSGTAFSAPATITLAEPLTINSIIFDALQPLTLSGSNLTLNAGGAASNLVASGADHAVQTPITLSTGGLITEVAPSRTFTVSGVISGENLGLVKTGEGTLLLAANNTYSGNTSITAGTLVVGDGATSGSLAGSITNSGMLRFNRSDSLVLGQPISGAGNVVFAGTGDTTLSVANTHTGTTSVTAGTLILAHASALQNSTLDYAATGGSLAVADPLETLVLGGISGDKALPLINTLGTPLSLTVGGNNASTTYSGSSPSAGAALAKNGTGTLSLAGTNAFTGNLTVNNGTLALEPGSTLNVASANLGTGSAARLLINGGTLTASGISAMPNASVGIAVAAGEANFNGGIVTDANNSSGDHFIHVTGGTLNTTTITTSRGSLSITSEPTSGQTTQGIYVNGGTLNVSEALNIGSVSGANSSVTARIDSGTLNVSGPLTVGINNVDRWSVLDVNGGTLNADHESGIQLGSAFAGRVMMHVRNPAALVNTPRIQFGQGALAGRSILTLGSGSVFVGAGGLALGSTDATFIAELRLNGGTLGATADWSSTIPVVLAGNVLLTGASSIDQPYTVRLQGPVSGIGAFTKTGSGTVILDNPANNFFGPANIESGRLELAGSTTDVVTVSAGATLAPRGVLIADFGTAINGRLAIRYDRNAETPVARLQTNYDINIGAGATLAFEGTGSLTEPAYVIIKAGFGINGTFASVTGLPAGYTLDYNYLEEGATVPSVAIVGGGTLSPFEQWLDANALTGEQALQTADPDADGLGNLIEYALGTSPNLATSTADAYTLARSGNFLTLGFDQPGDPTLVYTVEATNDLATGSWSPVHTFPSFNTAGAALYTDTANLTTSPRRFLRLSVSFAP